MHDGFAFGINLVHAPEDLAEMYALNGDYDAAVETANAALELAHELSHLLIVTDLSGRIGKPYYFTSELFFQPKGGGDFKGEIVQLLDNKGIIPAEVKGPPNKLFPSPTGETQYVTIPMTLTVADDKSHLDIAVGATKLTMKPGEWSDWVPFVFPFNSVIQVHGIGKFRLISIDPEVRLYYRFYFRTVAGGKYLCVVVKVGQSGAFVLTAYLTKRVKKGVQV